MYYSGSQHMDISREDAQKRPTLTNWWMTKDAEFKNYQLQWKTEKGGGSVSWNSEHARPNDDDDIWRRSIGYTFLTTCPWTKMKTKILKIGIILENLQISTRTQNNVMSFITRDTIFSRTENSEAAKNFTILHSTFPWGAVCVAALPSCFKRFLL